MPASAAIAAAGEFDAFGAECVPPLLPFCEVSRKKPSYHNKSGGSLGVPAAFCENEFDACARFTVERVEFRGPIMLMSHVSRKKTTLSEADIDSEINNFLFLLKNYGMLHRGAVARCLLRFWRDQRRPSRIGGQKG